MEIAKLDSDLSNLEIDLEQASPFSSWVYVEVVFPAADLDVTVRHKLRERPESIVAIPVSWRFPVAPATPPAIYTMLGGNPPQLGYIKLRSTVAGFATVLLVARRDGDEI